jgi:hypothetical protein
MKIKQEIDNEILTAHKTAGINFVWLVDCDGEIIIPRNQKKEGYQDKIKEIKKRIPFLAPGTYFLNGLTTQNTKRVKPLQFTLTIGTTGVSEIAPVVRYQQTDTVNVLSYSEALKRAEEISVLKIENESLKKQIFELEEANDELAEELEQLKGKQKETETPTLLSQGKDFLNQILPIISPLADEYFKLQNRKLDVLSQNKPAPVTQNQVRTGSSTDPQFRPHPEQNPQLWEQYLQELDGLNDEQFNNELEFLQNNYPLQYSYVEQIFFTEGTNDTNETNAEQ